MKAWTQPPRSLRTRELESFAELRAAAKACREDGDTPLTRAITQAAVREADVVHAIKQEWSR